MTFLSRLRGRVASFLPGNVAFRLDSGPICSFTFDDCHRTAATVGGRLLEEAGVGGTYFVSSSMLDESGSSGMLRPGDIPMLLSRGHEVACHTFEHRAVASLNAAALTEDLNNNARRIAQLGGPERLVSFSYPFGEVSNSAKSLIGKRFAVGRGVREGLNYRVLDLAELRACRIFHEEYCVNKIRELISECRRRSAWLIFYTHDIEPAPSRWGCTPTEFLETLEEVRRAGIPIETVRSAVGRIMFRPA